jgi:cytochrome c peroxidase
MKNQGWFCGAIAFALVGCIGADADGVDTNEAKQEAKVNGKQLFEDETFGGNGRTCATCHGSQTGTVSPQEAQALFAQDPNAALFRAIDSDDGVGSSYTRLLADATILVTIDLPANWSLADDPTATSITLPRAIPSTLNVPSFDSMFMADGRFDNLQDQAHGAVNSHYEPGRQPTGAELDAIAEHQQTTKFFSNNALKHYANGGPAPTLPAGNSAAEKRGRAWFVSSAAGVCSHCHDGPLLNETNQFLLAPLPPGSRFFTAFVSELNKAGSPVRTFNVTNGDGTVSQVSSTDPGLALISGNPNDANFFRIPTLWGSAKTGPWFHDNSAKTLEDLAQHYSDYFQIVGLPALTAQEQADIIAYLKLL